MTIVNSLVTFFCMQQQHTLNLQGLINWKTMLNSFKNYEYIKITWSIARRILWNILDSCIQCANEFWKLQLHV